jgi:flagellar protein FliL
VEEEIEEEGGEEEAPPKKSPLKWIIIGVVVLVLTGGGYVGWSMVQKSPDTGDAVETQANPEDAPLPEDTVGLMFSMDPFVVNLNESGGKRYLKSKIEIEYTGDPVRTELTGRLPQLRDVILVHLSSKTMEEIQSVDGKIELKNALIQRINQVLKQGKVRNLYFTQFVIQ